jgi:hypothetical protein
VINEISLVGVRIFNVINNRVRSIKHIQNNLFGDVDVIMIYEQMSLEMNANTV